MSKSARRITLVSVIVLCIVTMSVCMVAIPWNTKPNNEVSIDNSIAKDSVVDMSKFGDASVTNLDGTLNVPFDIAYKDYFESGVAEYAKDTVLLKMNKEFNGKVSPKLSNIGVTSMTKFMDTEKGAWYRAKIDTSKDVKKVVGEARLSGEVMIADYDYVYENESVTEPQSTTTGVLDVNALPTEIQGNAQLATQWYLAQCGIPNAWKFLEEKGMSAGGRDDIVVAVIDTGVDYNHPDLKANMWTNMAEIPGDGIDNDGNGYVDDVHGVDVIANNGTGDRAKEGNPMDDHGHGTHVAGIIAASNNKEGIVGIAYNAKIMAVKAGQASGIFLQSDIAEAIMYAAQMGADVINMSFGGTACSIAVQDALTTAYTRATLVASAGNDGAPNEIVENALPNYPAALQYVIGVMSVDDNEVESIFTNYDVKEFTSVEYEVYAPGEAIMSTLPRGRYAKLSGTSMAAPVVSGIAALLRSYFSDRDMYPSKYIAAQVSATSEDHAICCNSREHGPHNLPMIVNAFAGLTKLPKPDINLLGDYEFDSTEIAAENNGDGVVDSGETLDIAPVLRNRWGMSKETVVRIDALSDLGEVNPYVEIINDTVNFNGVGTYSTKDFLTRNTDNAIVGTSQPFKVKIKKNCPNEYLIVLNVTISYKNGLDETDLQVYQSKGKISFVVRNGVVLPDKIMEDMTLTKENYYIVDGSIYVGPNATLRVEPGTQIQFGCKHANMPSDQFVAPEIVVDGKLLVNGSPEELVKITVAEFLCQTNYQYCVRIKYRQGGFVNLNYAHIKYPCISIQRADHCLFEGEAKDNLLDIKECTNTLIRYLPDYPNYTYRYYLYGYYEKCHFASCGVNGENCYFKDCVFDDMRNNSKIVVYDRNLDFSLREYQQYNGKTYVEIVGPALNYQNARDYAKGIGGHLQVLDDVGKPKFQDAMVGVRCDDKGMLVNGDGTSLNTLLFPVATYGDCYRLFADKLTGSDSWGHLAVEFDSIIERTEIERRLESKKLEHSYVGNSILNDFYRNRYCCQIRPYGGGQSGTITIPKNYWCTTDMKLIERQIYDFDDDKNLMDIEPTGFLTTPPEDVWPFVTDVYVLNSHGERATKVSNEEVTFCVEFNRDMNVDIPLRFRFGSSVPFAEYEVNGTYETPRKWTGKYLLKTTIENGNQYYNIENAEAASDAFFKLHFVAGKRFGFEIDTTAAQAMLMQGEAREDGVSLTWMQDDFDTLAGYNVYRSDKEDGLYTRVNDVVLPVDTKTILDTDVEPAKIYYYNFTVVKTDMTESKPSGKIVIRALDTMAPGVHHTSVREYFAGNNLNIIATITDNLMIKSADVYYRVKGAQDWSKVSMIATNSRYIGTIPAASVTTAGLEYYIDAFDGVNHTYKGTSDVPISVIVKEAVSDNSLGDVDGNGIIETKDALMLLQAANDLLNLSAEQFARADINKDGQLNASEALRILEYVSGKVTTIL